VTPIGGWWKLSDNRQMKKFLFGTSSEQSTQNEFAMTFLRVFAGLTMALSHGIGKVPPSDMLVQGVGAMGFPLPGLFAWAAGLAELGGGLLLAIGFFTRPSAFFLAFTMAIAAFVAHAADPFAKKELGLLYFAIYLVFMIRGSGKWSIDHYIKVK
jgi:putative oxidoreductase